eukprot:UN2809
MLVWEGGAAVRKRPRKRNGNARARLQQERRGAHQKCATSADPHVVVNVPVHSAPLEALEGPYGDFVRETGNSGTLQCQVVDRGTQNATEQPNRPTPKVSEFHNARVGRRLGWLAPPALLQLFRHHASWLAVILRAKVR